MAMKMLLQCSNSFQASNTHTHTHTQGMTRIVFNFNFYVPQKKVSEVWIDKARNYRFFLIFWVR